MRRNFIALAALSAVTICSSAAVAANRAGSFNLTPVIGGYHWDGTQVVDANMLYGIKAGYNFTDQLGMEGLLHYMHAKEYSFGSENTLDAVNLRLEGLYHFTPQNKLVPFLAFGVGGLRSYFNSDNYDDSVLFSYGGGAKYALTDNVALRCDARMMSVYYNPQVVYNYEYTLGLDFQFGGKSKAVQAVAQAPKAAEAKPVPPAPTTSLKVSPATVTKGQMATLSWSSQNSDSCDIQPGIGVVQTSGSRNITPSDTTDYTIVCKGEGGSSSSKAALNVTRPPTAPSDTDKDGVNDNMDKCPGTPSGVKVDKDGCPLDSDKDGVADYLDKCPATSASARVDMDGCPLDSDRDGVADYLDKCPDTPAGEKVDTGGCTLDSDKDGVSDTLDSCPDTPSGDKVDKKGCSLPVCKSMKLEIEFDTNKADIKPVHHDELKKVGDMLEKFPKATAAIEGHTDNVGSAKLNLKLSQRRADSVRKYIVDKFGIVADRITAIGYGMTKPIATNKTAEGRKDNRRVEAILNCGSN